MVAWYMYVRDAFWRDTILCRIFGGNIWEDHESQGGKTNKLWPITGENINVNFNYVYY